MKKSHKSRRFKRERRYFSEDFRRARVKEYESGQTTVGEICRAYEVSRTSVYKWIHKYSTHYQKSIVKIVEQKSESKKRLALEQKIKDLEQLIGQQQVELSYYKKILELAEQHYQFDFEKNFDRKLSNGFSRIDPNTD